MAKPDALSPPPLTFGRRVRAAWLRLRFGAPTAWTRAICWTHESSMEALWAAGVPARDLDSSAMFQALNQENPRFLAGALACGASPDQQHKNNYWDFLLHRAVARAQAEHVAALLAAGANLEVLDGNGYTPLGTALHGFSERAADWEHRRPLVFALLAAGARADAWQWHDRQSVLASIPSNDTQLLERLIQAGARPDALVNPHPEGNFSALDAPSDLLFRAAELPEADGLPAFLALCARHGQGPSTRTASGQGLPAYMVGHWPSDLATYPPVVDCIKVLDILSNRGYDVLATDAQGNTLLHAWASSSASRVNLWAEALLSYPGMRNLYAARNASGKTALDLLESRSDAPADAPWLAPYRARLRSEALDRTLPSAQSAPPAPRQRL